MTKISTAKEALALSLKNGYDLELVRKTLEDDAWDEVMAEVADAAKRGQVCAHVTFRDDRKRVFMRLIDAGFDPTKMDYISEGNMYYRGVIYWAEEK